MLLATLLSRALARRTNVTPSAPRPGADWRRHVASISPDELLAEIGTRASGLTEEEAESLLGKLDELNQKKLKLESDFHQKSRKIIGARKMLKVISAERRFDRQILHKMMDRKK